MATELNLNTLNWVTLTCPDCAAEVQVLEDDVESGLIRCPGCGEAIVSGDAENEPAADLPEHDSLVETPREEKNDAANDVRSKATPDEPSNDEPAEAPVAESFSDHPAIDRPVVVDVAVEADSDGPSAAGHSEKESEKGIDEARAESCSAEHETDPENKTRFARQSGT